MILVIVLERGRRERSILDIAHIAMMFVKYRGGRRSERRYIHFDTGATRRATKDSIHIRRTKEADE